MVTICVAAASDGERLNLLKIVNLMKSMIMLTVKSILIMVLVKMQINVDDNICYWKKL